MSMSHLRSEDGEPSKEGETKKGETALGRISPTIEDDETFLEKGEAALGRNSAANAAMRAWFCVGLVLHVCCNWKTNKFIKSPNIMLSYPFSHLPP